MTRKNTILNRRHVIYPLFLNLIIGLLAARFLTNIFTVKNNTLENNGHWISTKTKLEMPVMGAGSFVTSTQPLAKERLNLGSWHGYQEVIYHKSVSPYEIGFSFLLSQDSYLNFFFNYNNETFYGIRLSGNKRFNHIFFKASRNYKFLDKEIIPHDVLGADKWHHAKIRFQKDRCLLYINDVLIRKLTLPVPEKFSFGFRGSYLPVYIDDVSVYSKNHSLIFHENFSYSRYPSVIFTLFFILIVLANLLIARLGKIKQLSDKDFYCFLVMLNCVFLACSFLFSEIVSIAAGRYPSADKSMLSKEEHWRKERIEATSENIKKQFATDARGRRRVLFLGTSQTKGAGAFKKEETLVNIAEKTLNKLSGPAVSYECINAGISSLHSDGLFKVYTEDFSGYKPDITVINLSFNDHFVAGLDKSKKKFAYFLERFVSFNRKAGIKTVFCLEPNSTEYRLVHTPLHFVMKNIAKKHNIPVIDLHRFMAENYDEGFLWWDIIHLTTCGYQLAGEFIAEKLIENETKNPGDMFP